MCRKPSQNRYNNGLPSYKILFAIAFMVIMTLCTPKYSHAIERINPSVDLVYLGAFRVPTDSSSNYSWGWLSPHGLTFNPYGDGGKGSLISPSMIVSTSSNFAKVTEFSIPDPVISQSKRLSDLPVAHTLHDWKDITQGKYDQNQYNKRLTDMIVVPPQGSQSKPKIYWITADWYKPPENFPSLGMSDLDFSNPNAKGPWIISGSWVADPNHIPSAKTSQYIFSIPESWANKYVNGYTIGVGANKPNGGGSRGACLYAVKPWNSDNPPWAPYSKDSSGQIPHDAMTDSIELLCPGMDIAHRRNYDHSFWDDFSYSDGQQSVVWVDNGTNGAIIFSGQVAYAPAADTGDCDLSKGEFCEYYKLQNPPGMGLPEYCDNPPCPASPDACPDGGDYRGEPYIQGLWFYDINDITDVVQGKKKPWEPQPYVFYNLENYFFSQSTCGHIGGIAYHPVRKRLYVAELVVDDTISVYDKMPIIHVFEVRDSALSADTQPPSSVNLSCKQYDNYTELSWSPATDNRGSVLYIIHRNGKAAAVTTETTFRDYNFSAYPAPYTYQIEIRDVVNNISFSNSASPGGSESNPDEKPSKVQDVEVLEYAQGQLKLGWQPASGTVSGYKVYFGEANNSTYEHTITITSPLSFPNSKIGTVLSGFLAGKTYQIAVSAYNGIGEGDLSNPVNWTCPTSEEESGYSNVVNVSTVEQIENAIDNLQSDTEILIDPGTYTLTRTLLVSNASHVVIRGKTGDKDAVTIKGLGMNNPDYGNAGFGIIIANAQDVTIQDLTVEDFYFHDIMIKGEESPQRPVLRNLHLKDAGEQLIKVSAAPNQNSYCDGGIVENCLIEYTDRARSWYTNGLDALAVKGWIVRDNTFKNIRAPEGQLAGPAILFWQNSIDTIVERNHIINCDIGIAFGNSSGPTEYARDGETTYDHQGGIIRNNFVFRNHPGDVGISVNKAKDFQIVNNTVILNGTFGWSIEYRFPVTQGLVANNLTDGDILSRNGAQASTSGNITTAETTWFRSISTGDLHLTAQAEDAIDHATVLASVSDDIDGEARGVKPDVGADEFNNAGSSETTPPGDVINFTATPGDREITLSWTNPSDSDFAGVMIRYRTDTWPIDYNDGQLLCNRTGTPGSSDSFMHTGLQNETTYYYSAFTYDSLGNYSQAAHVSTTPGSTGDTNQAPTASISASPTSGKSPLTVNFSGTGSDSDGTIQSYSWNFGDSTTSTSQNPTHTYARVSSQTQYTVSLTVTDDDGATAQTTTTITVLPDTTPPTAPRNFSVE